MKADLSQLPMFRGVEPDDLRDLLEYMQSVQFDRGELVFEQGDVADGALIVVSGQLQAKVVSGETERNIGTVHPGELCGEAGFFQRNGLRNARVVATQPSTCLRLAPEAMQPTLGNPAMAALDVIWWHRSPSFVARMWGSANMEEQAAREEVAQPVEKSRKHCWANFGVCLEANDEARDASAAGSAFACRQ